MATSIQSPFCGPKQIRFVNNQGQPPSKRRRINAACLTCRRRKTRCAGERPSCSTCEKNGHKCLGYPDAIDKKDGGGSGSEDGVSSARAVSSSGTSNPERSSTRDPKKESGDVHSMSLDLDEQEEPGDQSAMDKETAARVSSPAPLPARPLIHRSASFNKTRDVGRSPTQPQSESHRVPYFRYFGPTAIVPGYKQMVVDVSARDRHRSRGSFSVSSPGSSLSRYQCQNQSDMVFESADDLPVYDPSEHEPVHPLFLNLLKTFFVHLGCSFPFLKEAHILRMVSEKRVEPILVDAMCALAARFCDPPLTIKNDDGDVLPRSACGGAFAQRAKAATVDTFLCPTVGAVQACLIMAYEGFGADQDSALWMYLGIAIRMAVDLGLPKIVGVQCQDGTGVEESDANADEGTGRLLANTKDTRTRRVRPDSLDEQCAVEQERADTFWAVFFLDRVISSGTGRPVTFRDDDVDLALPEPTLDPVSNWPAPFPTLVQIINIYGRVSDVLNHIHNADDLNHEKMQKLAQMENELTRLYQRQDPRLNFNATNFQQYVHSGQSGNFILLHFWFHALIIILHQPTLLAPFGGLPRDHQLLANSHVLSMSSAKTIADILAFAELIDPKSFIGNPFTSQPMYIAACAFLAESIANASLPASRDASVPPPDQQDGRQEGSVGGGGAPSETKLSTTSKHSLLAANANQNYQRCYKSLQQMHTYWGGVRYILTALDQKAKGIWDCETFTLEEYESTRFPRRRGSFRQLPILEHPNAPDVPPIAWSLTGTSNSESPSLTLLFQSHANLVGSTLHDQQTPKQRRPLQRRPPLGRRHTLQSQSQQSPEPSSARTPPPGGMVYDPIRQNVPDVPAIFASAYPQATESAVRYSSQQQKRPEYRHSLPVLSGSLSTVPYEFDQVHADDLIARPYGGLSMYEYGQEVLGPMQGGELGQPQTQTAQTTQTTQAAQAPAEAQPLQAFRAESSSGGDPLYGKSTARERAASVSVQQENTSPADSSLAESGQTVSGDSYMNRHGAPGGVGLYGPDVVENGFAGSPFPSYLSGGSMGDVITLDSQEIDLSSVTLPDEMPQQWLAYLPGDISNLFDSNLV